MPDNLSEKPVFIGGMFKSGTSLLRAMLGNHSMVASGLETYWFDLDWSSLDSPAMVDRLRVIGEFFELDPTELAGLAGSADTAEAFLSRLMAFWACKLGKPRWAEKTPGNACHIDRIRAYWPSAYVVHIIRDPRDIFASLKEAGKWNTIDAFFERWTATFASVEAFRQNGLLSDDHYLEIRYEDLVTDPEAVMRKVCWFCELPYEPQVSIFSGRGKDFEVVRHATGKSSSTLARLSEPITKSRLGIWQSDLDESELRALAAAADRAGLGQVYERICG